MSKFKLIFCVIALSALATSCASISKEECEVGSWSDIGERDSSAGKKKSQYYKYVKDCGKHGIKPNKDEYGAGYKEGLKSYCTASNGFDVGRKGSSNPKICPKSLRTAFETSYRKGKAIHSAESKVKSKSSEIQSIEDEISDIQSSLTKGKMSGSKAGMLAMKIDKLRLQQRSLEKEKVVLEKDLERIEAQ